MFKFAKGLLILLGILLFPTVCMAATLADKAPGSLITFSNREWMILEHKSNGETYILLKGIDSARVFNSEGYSVFYAGTNQCDNIGKYLNISFYNSLSQKDLIKYHYWSTNDEQGGIYSSDVYDKVGLLSYDEYKAYSNLFNGNLPLNFDNHTYWTITPRHDRPDGYNEVWRVEGLNFVHLFGPLSSYPVTFSDNVRPALYLDSNLLLSGSEVTGETGEATLSISVINITQNSATVQWNNVEADSYNIYLNGSPIYNTTSCQYGLTDLQEGTQYTVTVKAVVNGFEAQSDSVGFTTESAAQPPPEKDSGAVEAMKQFTNLFGSLTPVLWPFFGALIAMFVFTGIITIVRGRF